MGSGSVAIPPPPPGFDYDSPPPQKAAPAVPPPPPGFDFDSPPPQAAGPQIIDPDDEVKPKRAPMMASGPVMRRVPGTTTYRGGNNSLAVPGTKPAGEQMSASGPKFSAPQEPEDMSTGALLQRQAETPLIDPGNFEGKNSDSALGYAVDAGQSGLQAAAGMTSPANIAITAATLGLAAIPGVLAKAGVAGVSAYFATQAGKQAIETFPELKRSVQEGDWHAAASQAGNLAVNLGMAYGAGKHAYGEVKGIPGEYLEGRARKYAAEAEKAGGDVPAHMVPGEGEAPAVSAPAPEAIPPPPPGFDYDAPPPQAAPAEHGTGMASVEDIAPAPAAEATPEATPEAAPAEHGTASVEDIIPEPAAPAEAAPDPEAPAANPLGLDLPEAPAETPAPEPVSGHPEHAPENPLDLDLSSLGDVEPPPQRPTIQAVHGSLFGGFQPFMKQSMDEARALLAKFTAAKNAMSRLASSAAQKADAQALREYMTGERDFWGVRNNQTISMLRKFVPDFVDQEALSLMRDFHNKPGELQGFLDGTHPDLQKLSPQDLQKATANLDKIRPAMERALNPTPQMLAANDVLTQIADLTKTTGEALGIFNSGISSEEYVTHLLHPEGEGEFAGVSGTHEFGSAMGGKIGRQFQFSSHRSIPTLAHAVAEGLRPKTLNAFDAFTIHGDKFATARASKLLVSALKDKKVGVWGKNNAPADWVEIAPHAHPFQNQMILKTPYDPMTGTGGESYIHRQTLYVPRAIEEALRPLTDPNYMNRVAGFQKARVFQAAAKAGELSLSLFHVKAENYMALANMGAKGWWEAQKADMDSPAFRSEERHMVLMGGTSPMQGRTFEAYKSLQPGSIPTGMDIARKLPVIRQVDELAGGLTHFIFDNQLRRFKVTDYSLKKAAWMAKNPNAGAAEFSAAMHSITKQINSTYGGLHWENLGVNKATQNAARFFLLAPDWTFSNLQSVKTLGEGGIKGTPASQAARLFWLRAVAGGMAATQGYSLLVSGQMSKNPTMAYLGKDSQGKEMYRNVGFSGVQSDVITLVNNMSQYGLVGGFARSLAGKLAPGFRTAAEAAFNEDFLGRKIASQKFSFAVNSARSAVHLAKGISPIPFTLTNTIDLFMEGDKKQKATAEDIIGTFLFGQPAKHIGKKKPVPVKPGGHTLKSFMKDVKEVVRR